MQIPFEWTDETVTRLIELRKRGMPFTNIAAELGTTRNACCGKFARIAEVRAKNGSPIVLPAKAHSNHNGHPKRPPKPAWQPPAPVQRYKPRPEPVATIAIPETNRVTLEDLRAHHCRWVVGEPVGFETVFCGNPVERRSYCAGHIELAFYVPQTRRQFRNGRPIQ